MTIKKTRFNGIRKGGVERKYPFDSVGVQILTIKMRKDKDGCRGEIETRQERQGRAARYSHRKKRVDNKNTLGSY